MRTYTASALLGALLVVACGPVAAVTTVPLVDSTYVTADDMVTFNWRILAQKYPGIVTVPSLPTGNNVAPFLRIFSNGNTNSPLLEPVKWQDDDIGGPFGDFNAAQSAALWYGLEYRRHGNDPLTVSDILTGGDILTLIQGIDPGSTTPVFAFDQNQTPNTNLNDPLPPGWDTTPSLARDIWLRGRVILVHPDAIDPGTAGMGELLGLTPAQVNAAIDPLIAANDPMVTVFSLRDTTFLDFPPDWAYLPGVYATEGYVADNNGDAAHGDWGGFFPGLDLTDYTDYGMFVELQTLFDNNGQEEAYIIGGLRLDPLNQVVPEPLTVLALMGAVGALGQYVRKRTTG